MRARFRLFGVLSGASIPVWPQEEMDVAGVAGSRSSTVTYLLTQQFSGGFT
jgi:hypothetical protein